MTAQDKQAPSGPRGYPPAGSGVRQEAMFTPFQAPQAEGSFPGMPSVPTDFVHLWMLSESFEGQNPPPNTVGLRKPQSSTIPSPCPVVLVHANTLGSDGSECA